MNNAGRMTTTARRDIGACSLEPDRKAWVRGLRTDVFAWASRPPKGMKTEAVGSRSIEAPVAAEVGIALDELRPKMCLIWNARVELISVRCCFDSTVARDGAYS